MMQRKLKPLWLFIMSTVLGTAVFFLALVMFVDMQVFKKIDLFLHYFLDFERTYVLSVPSYGVFYALSGLILIYEALTRDSDYGDAEFATNRDITSMHENGLYEPTGTILALKDGRYIRTNESLSTLIVAPQGTGKTAAIIIPTLLSDRSSAIINDVKGELWDKTSLQRSMFGRVGIFAPSKRLDGALRWNPLDKKCLPSGFDDQIDFVERIGSILYPTDHDGMDATAKHFNAEGRSVFTYWAMSLIHKKGGTSLPEIYMTALESDDMQGAIACDLDDYENEWHPILKNIANSILGKGGNEYNGTVTTFKQALEPFSRPNIARNLMDCDFTHEDFKDEKPFSLYLFIPANDISRMAPIVRMLVEYLVNEFLSMTDQSVIQRQRVLFCMDEFPRMGYMKALKEAPALQRSYKMASLFVAQDKNQLETTYGQGSFDQFVTTTDFKVIFRQNEDTTAARFSTLIGKTTRTKRSVSQRDLELLGSTSDSLEGVPLILPQDFMSQKKNELIVLASGHHERPIKAKCAWWFKDANMKKVGGKPYNGLTISDLSSSTLTEKHWSQPATKTADDVSNNDVNNKTFTDLQENPDKGVMMNVENKNTETHKKDVVQESEQASEVADLQLNDDSTSQQAEDTEELNF